MSKFTKSYLQSILPGSKLIVKDEDDGDFEGNLDKITFSSNSSFVITLENCKKVGSSKLNPGLVDFFSDEIEDIEVCGVEKAKPKISEGKTFPLGGQVSRRQHRYDNPHLSGLHPPEMPEILAQKQIAPVPHMHKFELQKFSPRLLPVPAQEIQHMTGEKFKDRLVEPYKIIRNATWIDALTPPNLTFCPKKLYFIENQGEIYDFAIEELNNESILGLSMQGKQLSRTGTLSLILFSTKNCVFLFDVLALTDKFLFDPDSMLRSILEDSGIIKVVHDSRLLSDLLHHKYQLEISNVYDTLAAHVIFSTWAIYHGFMPKYAIPLTDLVRGYLGVKPQFLYFPHRRVYALEKDTENWLNRPLENHMEMNAVYDVIYLLDLHRLTKKAMEKPFKMMTQVLLSDIRDSSDIDNSIKVPQTHLMPSNSRKVLPNWRPNEGRAARLGMVDGAFVHQTTCQIDPMLNFSRDVIHQKKPPGPYNES